MGAGVASVMASGMCAMHKQHQLPVSVSLFGVQLTLPWVCTGIMVWGKMVWGKMVWGKPPGPASGPAPGGDSSPKDLWSTVDCPHAKPHRSAPMFSVC